MSKRFKKRKSTYRKKRGHRRSKRRSPRLRSSRKFYKKVENCVVKMEVPKYIT